MRPLGRQTVRRWSRQTVRRDPPRISSSRFELFSRSSRAKPGITSTALFPLQQIPQRLPQLSPEVRQPLDQRSLVLGAGVRGLGAEPEPLALGNRAPLVGEIAVEG